MVPPVRVTTVEMMKKMPGLSTKPGWAFRLTAMPNDWARARTTVR